MDLLSIKFLFHATCNTTKEFLNDVVNIYIIVIKYSTSKNCQNVQSKTGYSPDKTPSVPLAEEFIEKLSISLK